MIRSQPPSLKKKRDEMSRGEHLQFGIFVSGGTMRVAVARQSSIAAPNVCMKAAASFDCFLNHFCQNIDRRIVQHSHTNAPHTTTRIFGFYQYQRLTFSSRPCLPECSAPIKAPFTSTRPIVLHAPNEPWLAAIYAATASKKTPRFLPVIFVAATRADITIRPTHTHQIVLACIVRCKHCYTIGGVGRIFSIPKHHI